MKWNDTTVRTTPCTFVTTPLRTYGANIKVPSTTTKLTISVVSSTPSGIFYFVHNIPIKKLSASVISNDIYQYSRLFHQHVRYLVR